MKCLGKHLETVVFLSLFCSMLMMLTTVSYADEKSDSDYLSQYEARIFHSYDGLVSAEINAVAQTDDGYIWVGTYSGLYRYDGHSFEKMDIDKNISNVMVLFSDSKGRLWIGTNDSGLACYNPESYDIDFYTPEEGLSSYSIRSISEDEFGNIYVGTVSYLSSISPSGDVTSYDDLEEFIGIRSLSYYSDGTTAGVTNSGILFFIKDGKITAQKNPEDDGVYYTTVQCCNSSEIIAGTSEHYLEILEYDGSKTTSLRKIKTEKISYHNKILYDEENNGYFVCADNGMCLLNTENDTVTYLMQENFNASVSDVIKDYQGNIWFVSNKQGILEYSQNPFRDLFVHVGLDSDVVNCTALYDNLLYIGCDNGMHIVDMSNYELITNSFTDALAEVRIRHILPDSKGNIWVSTYGRDGLVELKSDGTIKTFNETEGTAGGRFRYALELNDGTILAASNMGLNYILDDGITATISEDDGMKATQILTMYECDDNEILAGSDGDGIYRIKDGKIVDHIGMEEGLNTMVVLRIVPLEEGFIYVTSNALYYDDDNGNITKLDNFPYTNCYDIFINDDLAWIFSSAGIYIVRLDDLIANKEYNYALLDYSRGFTTSLTANSWNSTIDDNLLLCCTDGIREISTSKFGSNVDDYYIRLNSVTYGDKTITPNSSGKYTIPAGNARIKIKPAVLDYSLSNPLVHIYLEGLDDNGITTYQDNMEELNYTNLPYGKYKLHVAVLDSITGDTTREEIFTINKKPYFTELLIFRIFVLVAGGALIAFLVWKIISITIISRQYEQIKEARDEAERANSAKSRFLANMSHEIRTPINTIMGMNQMIQREKNSDSGNNYRTRILGYSHSIALASETLLSLINDILDLSKIESGKMNLVEQEYDFPELLRAVISMIRVKSDEKGLDFYTDIDPSLPERLYGDDGKIKQVILNILTNANKYTEEGHFTLHVKLEKKNDELARIYFSVDDTGIGIKPEDIGAVFSAFQRLDEQRNSNIQGTGLGLDISHQFVELLGGELKVESEYQKGSNFFFTIDQKIIDSTPIGEFKEEENLSDIAEEYVPLFVAPEADILVVDDNDMNLMVINGLLSAVMAKIDNCMSGEECLDMVRKKDYDIILLDHMMPGMDGVETLHEIRKEYPDLIVIALTANAGSSGEKYYLSEGFNGYISKPVEGRILEEKLKQFLPESKVLPPSAINESELESGILSNTTYNQTTDAAYTVNTNQKTDRNGSQNKSEDEAILEKLSEIEEINIKNGLKFCGTKAAYVKAVRTFYDTLFEKADEIEEAYNNKDYKFYSIKVHALKSSARMIGFSELSELALKMEEASKAEDIETVDEHTADLLGLYRKCYDDLDFLSENDTTEGADDNRPEADSSTIEDAYSAIYDMACMMDYDSVEMILDSISEYKLPAGDATRFENIRLHLKKLEWEAIQNEVTK